jgi:hypothetical protein
MDYLPVQATSVPCERIFSSAKETDTTRRNQIGPVLMEALQLLKFSLKKERLNFISGWSISEAALDGDLPETTQDSLLDTLLRGDPDGAVDNVLHKFIMHDEQE